MRILLVLPSDEEFGGVTSVAGNLARYLQSRGHEVIFLHPANGILLKRKTTKWGFRGFELRLQPPFGERHPIISILAFPILFPLAMYQLMRLIRRHRIQIINIHYPGDGFFYFGLCRRILPIVLITSVHGADFFPNGSPKTRYSQVIRFLLRSSDRIVAPSRSYQEDFLTIFPDLKDNTTFIHNGVNLAELNDSSRNGTRNGQDPYVLCIAQHIEKKGLDVLLHALRRLQCMNLSLKLVLVGDGPLRQQLQMLAASLGIKDKVEFLGQRGRADVVELLRGCEVFVLPSRSEPFGIAIIEALACGKPVVATSVGGIPEIIENRKNGILVEPNNPNALAEGLLTVLKSQALQRVITSNGYLTVQERFRCENTGSSYEAIFGDLLNSLQS
jgi:glycosyltransferase involved in cell wall biosynthesis